LSKLIAGRYTRRGLWSLFLMCALPQHAWTMILAFRDLTWLTDRTNAWDAIGVLCYGLLFALVESLLVFLLAALVGLLLPRHWEPDRRVALLASLVLVLALWAVLAQLFFLANVRFPDAIIGFLVRAPHPLWIIYAALVIVVGATMVLPAWAVLRQGRGLQVIGSLIERLGLLAMFYLVFDIAALVIIAIRNL
jgi:hypothetical protein